MWLKYAASTHSYARGSGAMNARARPARSARAVLDVAREGATGRVRPARERRHVLRMLQRDAITRARYDTECSR